MTDMRPRDEVEWERRPRTGALLIGTTANPCPKWCKLPIGHGYDSDDGEGEYRTHERVVGTLEEPPTSVEIWAQESLALTVAGTTVVVGEPIMVLWADCQDVTMTAEQARELARVLLAAADEFDQVRSL